MKIRKPFNADAAKRGEPIVNIEKGWPAELVWYDKTGKDDAMLLVVKRDNDRVFSDWISPDGISYMSSRYNDDPDYAIMVEVEESDLTEFERAVNRIGGFHYDPDNMSADQLKALRDNAEALLAIAKKELQK
jgi:hypothetical protein